MTDKTNTDMDRERIRELEVEVAELRQRQEVVPAPDFAHIRARLLCEDEGFAGAHVSCQAQIWEAQCQGCDTHIDAIPDADVVTWSHERAGLHYSDDVTALLRAYDQLRQHLRDIAMALGVPDVPVGELAERARHVMNFGKEFIWGEENPNEYESALSKAKRERDKARVEVEAWKDASGLVTVTHGVEQDPDGITPERARKYWESVERERDEARAELERLRTALADLYAGCGRNYMGGYHDNRQLKIFRHGMATVCNVVAVALKGGA